MVFYYRVCGHQHADAVEAFGPCGVRGPWLELEAPSFDEAKRALAIASHETGFAYEGPREDLEEEA